MARFYALEIDCDLFGTIVARRHWGRIGTLGRSMTVPFPSLDAALHHVSRLAQTKRRRGYVERPLPCR